MNPSSSPLPMLAALLPAGELFESLYDRGILGDLAELGFSCIRPALRLDSRERLAKLHEVIRSAHVVLVDITARNPSAMYAAGVAHALEKPVIICALHAEDVAILDPVADSEPLIHSGSPEILNRLLTARLQTYSPRRSPGAPDSVDPTTKGTDSLQEFLRLFGEILGDHGRRKLGRVRVENPTTFALEGQELELAMVQDLARQARALGIRIKLL